MCLLIFSTTFVRNTSHYTRELYIVINVHRSSCKVPVILTRFQWSLDFLDRFSKSFKISNLMKILQWESSCCVRTDRQTDTTKLIVAFLNFANGPKMNKILSQCRTSICASASAEPLSSACWLTPHKTSVQYFHGHRHDKAEQRIGDSRLSVSNF